MTRDGRTLSSEYHVFMYAKVPTATNKTITFIHFFLAVHIGCFSLTFLLMEFFS